MQDSRPHQTLCTCHSNQIHNAQIQTLHFAPGLQTHRHSKYPVNPSRPGPAGKKAKASPLRGERGLRAQARRKRVQPRWNDSLASGESACETSLPPRHVPHIAYPKLALFHLTAEAIRDINQHVILYKTFKDGIQERYEEGGAQYVPLRPFIQTLQTHTMPTKANPTSQSSPTPSPRPTKTPATSKEPSPPLSPWPPYVSPRLTLDPLGSTMLPSPPTSS